MQGNAIFSPNQLSFIEWRAKTKAKRDPSTQEELAIDLGLNPCTLSRWCKRQDIKDAIVARARAAMVDALPDIYASLTNEAKNGSYQHQKLAFELAGEYVQKSEVGIEHSLSDKLAGQISDALARGYDEPD